MVYSDHRLIKANFLRFRMRDILREYILKIGCPSKFNEIHFCRSIGSILKKIEDPDESIVLDDPALDSTDVQFELIDRAISHFRAANDHNVGPRIAEVRFLFLYFA